MEPCACQSSSAFHVGPNAPHRASDSSLSFRSFELLARPVRRHQIFRVDELARDDEQRVATRNIESIEYSVSTAFAQYGTPFLRR